MTIETVSDPIVERLNEFAAMVREGLRNEGAGEHGKAEIVCTFSSRNNQCIGKRCPFSPVHHRR